MSIDRKHDNICWETVLENTIFWKMKNSFSKNMNLTIILGRSSQYRGFFSVVSPSFGNVLASWERRRYRKERRYSSRPRWLRSPRLPSSLIAEAVGFGAAYSQWSVFRQQASFSYGGDGVASCTCSMFPFFRDGSSLSLVLALFLLSFSRRFSTALLARSLAGTTPGHFSFDKLFSLPFAVAIHCCDR